MRKLASGKVGCVVLPLAWIAASLLISMIYQLAAGGNADDFGSTFMTLWFVGWAAIFLGYVIKAGSKIGGMGGKALRRVAGVDADEAQPDRVQTEKASLRRFATSQPIRDRPAFDLPREGNSGESASFTYTDVNGNLSRRRVATWFDDGEYIEAMDLDARSGRTFRKDRITDWRAD